MHLLAVVTAVLFSFSSSASAAQNHSISLDDACGSRPANAVAPSDTLTLDHALALTMERSPRLEAVCWELQALKARERQAGRRVNPEIGLTAENFAGSGLRSDLDQVETTLWISQRLELGGKRPKRREVARLDLETARWGYEAAALEVSIRTSRAFYEALAAQDHYRLAEELVGVAREAVATADAQFRAGAVPASERSRAEVALATAEIDLDAASRELTTRHLALAATWGARSARFERVEGDLEHLAPLPSIESLELLVAANPLLQQSGAEVDYREAVVTYEEAQGIPSPTVEVGGRYFGDANDEALVMQFSTPWPLFDRNQDAAAAALHDRSRAAAEQRRVEAELHGALRVAYERTGSAFARASGLRDRAIPASSKAFNEIRQAYRKGRVRYLEVLDAQRTFFELRVSYVDVLREYHLERLNIESMTGRGSAESAPADEEEGK